MLAQKSSLFQASSELAKDELELTRIGKEVELSHGTARARRWQISRFPEGFTYRLITRQPSR